MARLCDLSCRACRGGVPRLKGDGLAEYAAQVPDWEVVDEHHLARMFRFRDFVTALVFVNRVGELAEVEAHHPNISLAWGKVGIEVWTHKIDGLTESDFILAAKIDRL